jgi:hypothetical protein
VLRNRLQAHLSPITKTQGKACFTLGEQGNTNHGFRYLNHTNQPWELSQDSHDTRSKQPLLTYTIFSISLSETTTLCTELYHFHPLYLAFKGADTYPHFYTIIWTALKPFVLHFNHLPALSIHYPAILHYIHSRNQHITYTTQSHHQPEHHVHNSITSQPQELTQLDTFNTAGLSNTYTHSYLVQLDTTSGILLAYSLYPR